MAKSYLASAAIFTTSAAITVVLLHSWDIGLFGYGIETTVRNLHDDENVKNFESIGSESGKETERKEFLKKWMEETVCKIFNKKVNEGWRVNNEAIEDGIYRELLTKIKSICNSTISQESEENLKNILYGIKEMSKHNGEEDDFTFPPTIPSN